jgi:hypothetical protein
MTWLSDTDPAWLAARHHAKDAASPTLIAMAATLGRVATEATTKPR